MDGIYISVYKIRSFNVGKIIIVKIFEIFFDHANMSVSKSFVMTKQTPNFFEKIEHGVHRHYLLQVY